MHRRPIRINGSQTYHLLHAVPVHIQKHISNRNPHENQIITFWTEPKERTRAIDTTTKMILKEISVEYHMAGYKFKFTKTSIVKQNVLII